MLVLRFLFWVVLFFFFEGVGPFLVVSMTTIKALQLKIS